MNLDNLDVKTTAGEVFSGADSAKLAHMIYRRFGKDEVAAHAAWCRMLENNCTFSSFHELVAAGAPRKEADKAQRKDSTPGITF